MRNPCFFGYGSLVNLATHDYPNPHLASAHGWARAWVHTNHRPFAYLTAIRDEDSEIEGVIAEVPGADWAALDERERHYDRIDDSRQIRHNHPSATEVAIYAVPPEASNNVTEQHPILLSYLDVVLQGYLQKFGEAGAQRFIDTTKGWNAPILNDRANPIYPRHQLLNAQETDFVDDLLHRLEQSPLNRNQKSLPLVQ